MHKQATPAGLSCTVRDWPYHYDMSWWAYKPSLRLVWINPFPPKIHVDWSRKWTNFHLNPSQCIWIAGEYHTSKWGLNRILGPRCLTPYPYSLWCKWVSFFYPIVVCVCVCVCVCCCGGGGVKAEAWVTWHKVKACGHNTQYLRRKGLVQWRHFFIQKWYFHQCCNLQE